VRFGSDRTNYDQGQPVTITARVTHEELTPFTGLSFSAVAAPVAGEAVGSRPAPVMNPTVNEARFVEMPESPGYYRATLSGLPSGSVDISLRGAEVERLLKDDSTVVQKSLVISIASQSNREMSNMNTDLDRLRKITTAGGGVTVMGNTADVLAWHMPAVEHVNEIPMQMGFFADPNSAQTKWAHIGFLVLFALVLTLEWAIRKRGGLI
jgi:hypothetical protein